jgi:hypothetical protein
MSAAEQRERINSGRVVFVNNTVRINNMRRIRARNSRIIGDNNHVEGDNNVLIGSNNTAEGRNNKIEVMEPEPVRAVHDEPVADTDDEDNNNNNNNESVDLEGLSRDCNEAIRGFLNASQGHNDLNQLLATIQHNVARITGTDNQAGTTTTDQQSVSPHDGLFPPAGADSRHSHWKVCLLDLEGDAQPTEIEDMRCCICLENRFDTMFEPCHHLCCCRDCAKKLYSPPAPPKCPICKDQIKWASIAF